MAQQRTQGFFGALFWPAMVLLSAIIAGGIFAFVFAEVGGNGWRQGAGLGALVFVVAAFLFGRLATGTLPPPNTVRIDPAPAPTAPRSAPTDRAPAASRETSSARQSAEEAAGEVKQAAQSTFDRLRDAVKSGTEAVSERVKPAAPSNETQAPSPSPSPSSAATAEPPTTSARVTDAAKAAGEAARLMAEPAPAAEAAKPAGLEAPRDGGPDDLKKIKGIGPKLESLLHGLGYYHFDQIAGWGPGEIAWVDSNLEGFNGRATRDDWVGQARVLAAGGTTDFAERVEQGEVYDDD